MVFTAWRHAVGHVGERPNTHADGPEGCGRKSSVNISIFSTNIITTITINVDIEEEGEMTCPNTDGGAHADRGHCIWQQMLCDSHQVGFGGFWWILVGFSGFCWVLVDFSGFWWVLVGFDGF